MSCWGTFVRRYLVLLTLASIMNLLLSIVAKHVVVLPKSVNPVRIEANLKGALAAYKQLTADDVAKLDGVAASGKQKRLIMPPWGK